MLRRIVIGFGYLGLVLLVGGVTFGLVAYGNDYSYDFKTHKIFQKGHVIISSLPSGTWVSEAGRSLGKKTPFQAAFNVGSHSFGLTRDGYWPWEKTLQVVAGQVNLVRYALLVPKKPVVSVLDTKGQIKAQSLSKDHRHLAYLTDGAEAALYTLDLGNPKPLRLYAPQAATTTEPAEVLQEMTWSDDASHILLVSSVGQRTIWRIIAGNGGEAIDLGQKFGQIFNGVKFSASNWHQIYWIAPDGLRRLDVESDQSTLVAEQVTQFWITADRVLYAVKSDLGRSLWSVDSRGRRQELIQALVESDSYAVAYTSYQGDDLLGVVPAKTQVGTLYSDIFSDTPTAKVVARGVTNVSFAPDGHIVAFSSPTLIATYDLEQSAVTHSFVLYQIANQPGNLTALTWFDNYHLLANREGSLYWSEFDGANRVELTKVAAGLPAFATSDAKSVLAFRMSRLGLEIVSLAIR